MSTKRFLPWLFGCQDKRLKLQVVVASALVVTTGYVAIREQTTLVKRETAYQTILVAKQVQNDRAVLEASKEFLKNTSLFGKDERTPQVLEIYEESLVRWFARQPQAELKAAERQYLELYNQLKKTTNTEGKQP